MPVSFSALLVLSLLSDLLSPSLIQPPKDGCHECRSQESDAAYAITAPLDVFALNNLVLRNKSADHVNVQSGTDVELTISCVFTSGQHVRVKWVRSAQIYQFIV